MCTLFSKILPAILVLVKTNQCAEKSVIMLACIYSVLAMRQALCFVRFILWSAQSAQAPTRLETVLISTF